MQKKPNINSLEEFPVMGSKVPKRQKQDPVYESSRETHPRETYVSQEQIEKDLRRLMKGDARKEITSIMRRETTPKIGKQTSQRDELLHSLLDCQDAQAEESISIPPKDSKNWTWDHKNQLEVSLRPFGMHDGEFREGYVYHIAKGDLTLSEEETQSLAFHIAGNFFVRCHLRKEKYTQVYLWLHTARTNTGDYFAKKTGKLILVQCGHDGSMNIEVMAGKTMRSKVVMTSCLSKYAMDLILKFGSGMKKLQLGLEVEPSVDEMSRVLNDYIKKPDGYHFEEE